MINIQIIATILTMGSLAVALGFTVLVGYQSKSALKLIFASWISIFIWSLLNCLLFPMLLFRLGYQDAFRHFPEGGGVVGCALLGWGVSIFPAIIIIILRSLAKIYERFYILK